MRDPQLQSSRVTVTHSCTDGYESTQHFAAPFLEEVGHRPVQPLLDAIDELARLTALHGHAEESLNIFTAAQKRVAEWKEKRHV